MNIEDMDDDPDFANTDDPKQEEQVEDIKEQRIEKDNRGFMETKQEKHKENLSGWRLSNVQQNTTKDVNIDTSNFPLTKADIKNPDSGEVSSEEVLKMYWFDASEDPMRHPGTVWLFGKVWIASANAYVSCCVTVKNIPRRIYLAKRDFLSDSKTGQPLPGDKEVAPMDMYNEFNNKIAKRYKILEHKCRPVEKSYAFEHTDIPDNGQYLEVLYSSDYPSLPADLKGETFSKVFGTPQTSLEFFLLEQKMKGPGWLYIKGAAPHSPPTSWCKVEAVASDPYSVLPAEITDDIPPLTVMTMKIGENLIFFIQQERLDDIYQNCFFFNSEISCISTSFKKESILSKTCQYLQNCLLQSGMCK